MNDLNQDSNKKMNKVVNSRPGWQIQQLGWEIQQRETPKSGHLGNEKLNRCNKIPQWKASPIHLNRWENMKEWILGWGISTFRQQ
jgi:hypothetical protein